MKRSLVAAGVVLIGLGLSTPVWATDVPMPVTPAAPGSDTLVILVSDTTFGPDMEDANVAARFYCSTRGKLTTLVAKEHPTELRTQVFQQWSLLTYRCINAATSSAQ